MPVRSLGKGGSERRPLNNSLVDGLKEKRNDPSCQLAGGRAVDGAVVAPEDSPDAHVVVGLHHALEGRLKDSAVRRPTDEETVANPRRVDRRNRPDADPVPPLRHKTALHALAPPVHGRRRDAPRRLVETDPAVSSADQPVERFDRLHASLLVVVGVFIDPAHRLSLDRVPLGRLVVPVLPNKFVSSRR